MLDFKKLPILVFDFETAWDSKGYTLSKMTTEEYIRDPRFKAWGVGYKYYGTTTPPRWVGHNDLQGFFGSVDWANTAVLAQNTAFDAAILAWHYGHVPAFMFDTLSMARAVRGVDAGNSLKALAQAFSFPPKGTDVMLSDGILDVLPGNVESRLASYCVHDVELCEQVFKILKRGFPVKEFGLIDMTLRMFVEPALALDKEMLKDALEEERIRREGLLARLIINEDELASNDKFAEALRKMGVEPPMKDKKPTPTTPNPVGQTYAFAKTDVMFQALLNGSNEDLSLLCEARLAVKSTIMRTRAQRFLDISERGTLPVPLNYYGAHTGRWAAMRGSNVNLQNLKRGSALRKAIMAPDGYVVAVCDLSQIEPRVLAWLAGYQDLLDIFASGKDAYAAFGAQMFGIPGMTKDSHPVLRQSAKAALLGAGYGLGWLSFSSQLLTGFLGAPPILYNKEFAKQLGVSKQTMLDFMGYQPNVDRAMAIPRLCSDDEIVVHCIAAKQIIDKYRDAAGPVQEFWELCDGLIHHSLFKGRGHQHKCLNFEKERIILPSGLALLYPGLEATPDDRGRHQWTYGAKKKKLYGGKLTENIVQAVARCVMTDGMLRIQDRYRCVLTVHDEAVALIPEKEAEEGTSWMQAQMVMEPEYMPGIPLAAESGFHKRYGEAK